jgi:myosin heavy subunit
VDESWLLSNLSFANFEGSQCWVEMITMDDLGKVKEKDEEQEVFSTGVISEINKEQFKVIVKYDKDSPNGDPEKYINQVFELDLNRKIHKDMCEMEVLNEAELAENLKNRFVVDDFYTYIGPTLIAINPFKFYEKINNDEIF